MSFGAQHDRRIRPALKRWAPDDCRIGAQSRLQVGVVFGKGISAGGKPRRGRRRHAPEQAICAHHPVGHRPWAAGASLCSSWYCVQHSIHQISGNQPSGWLPLSPSDWGNLQLKKAAAGLLAGPFPGRPRKAGNYRAATAKCCKLARKWFRVARIHLIAMTPEHRGRKSGFGSGSSNSYQPIESLFGPHAGSSKLPLNVYQTTPRYVRPSLITGKRLVVSESKYSLRTTAIYARIWQTNC